MKSVNFCVGLIVTSLNFVIANAAFGASRSVQIKVPDSVGMSLGNRGDQTEAVIRVGNEFLRQILNGTARNEMSPEWETKTGAIVAMSSSELFQRLDDLPQENIPRVCQPVELDRMEPLGDGIRLVYRSHALGVVRWDTKKGVLHHTKFERATDGETWKITIDVDRNLKVFFFETKGSALPIPYFPGPSVSPFLNKKAFVGETPEKIRARSASHVEAQSALDRAAREICNLKSPK